MNLLEELGPELSGLQKLRLMMERDRLPSFAPTLGVRLVEAAEGRVVLEGAPGAAHRNAGGTVHGGFIATLLDFACGFATLSRMQPGQGFTTLELKTSYHRAVPADGGTVRAEGGILAIGRRASFAEGRLTDAKGRLLASATSTLIVFPPAGS